MAERVIVAMSGGVDSSVAAARLVDLGHEVIGVTLHLWDYPDDGSVKGRCCAPEDVHDARRVADTLKIPHFAFDRRELFEREVVGPFVEGYLSGTTPSPCVRCNRGVKMRELMHLAKRLGASRVATGHYARVQPVAGIARLHRAVDRSKDQSYFLHMLGPDVLERLTFPLGELTKPEVRRIAQQLDLPGANKGESQELCFVPTGRYDAFVSERAPGRVRPGPIVDAGGRELGTHQGIHQFTIGQRKNLGVAVGERAYVVDVDVASAEVRLGPREQLLAHSAKLEEFVVADDVELPIRCTVAVRYRGTEHAARVVKLAPGKARVEFEQPVQAVVPGQVAVLYDSERVLGGGTIQAADTRRPVSGVVARETSAS